MSAVLTRHAEQRAAAARLAELALAERQAWAAYAHAPEGAERDFSADSVHVAWHRALDAWGKAVVAYRERYGESE